MAALWFCKEKGSIASAGNASTLVSAFVGGQPEG